MLDRYYDFLEEIGVDEQFINGAIAVGGYNEETLNRVLEYTTGYHSMEQYIECELEEEE